MTEKSQSDIGTRSEAGGTGDSSDTSGDDGRPDLATVKQMRRDHPSGWLELAMTPARALLIDAILDSPPGHEFTTGTISKRAGISAQAVRNHIQTLVERGIVNATGGREYKVADDSRVLMEIEELNSAVTAVRSGMAQDRVEEFDPDRRMDNAASDDTGDDSSRGTSNEAGRPEVGNAD